MTIETEVPHDQYQTCRGCGCSNERACVWDAQPLRPGPIVWEACEWVEYDLCSQCA